MAKTESPNESAGVRVSVAPLCEVAEPNLLREIFPYDEVPKVEFDNVIEAPDEQTIRRVSLELGSRGTGRYETLSAIPIDDFIGAI